MSQQLLEGYEVSPQQKHVWTLCGVDGQAPYLAQCTILMEGALDQTVLKDALQQLLDRHEVLRTTFDVQTDLSAPLQIINDNSEIWFDECNLNGVCEETQSYLLDFLIRDIQQRHFGPGSICQPHFSLIRLAPDKHLLVVTLPSLYADSAALAILMREVGRCYAACLNDESTDAVAIQYADLCQWQNESLTAPGSEIGRDYWRRQNDSTPSFLTLPFEKDSTEVEFDPKLGLSQVIDAETVRKLREIGGREGSSLSSSLLGTFFVLLARLTEQSRLSVGVAFSGRNYEELVEALGLFARFLPIDAEVVGRLSFVELLATLEEKLVAAEQWQELYVAGEGDALPFCFAYEAEAEPELQVTEELQFRLLKSHAYVSRFKVWLRCLQQADGAVVAEWHYDRSRYSEVELRRVAEGWSAALTSIVAAAGRVALSAVPVVGGSEQAALLDYSRGAEVLWDGPGCVHERFAAQAAQTPAAVAVVYEDERLSYAELNQRANQLARYLRARGVGAEERVGLMLERSLEMVVGLLGILKAGGAYVPLEPRQPAERLRRMVQDAGVRVLVSLAALGAEAEALGVAEQVYLDRDAELIAAESSEDVGAVVSEQNAAYVIYTSGSTGSPKGVVISHQAISNRLLWMTRQFPLTPADRVLQKTPHSFDASIWEIFVPLFSGARVVMALPEEHKDSAYLVSKVIESEITTLQLVPSMLGVLFEEPRFNECRSLRRIFCGGELLSPVLQEQFFSRLDLDLNNLYGPTETAIDATCWTFRADDPTRAAIIGLPITNTEVHVLDEHLMPVPFGISGELYIGGVNLARGYLNQPALTAERFIPNPFSKNPGARLCRAVDLARRLENGAIEYLGRIDHQVKVRGFRIELGEIEAVLGQHPAVWQAVVTAGAEHKRLVAYVVPRDEAELSERELHEFLSGLLPEYMIPSAFVTLKEMPRLQNGKIDRNTLPAVEQVQRDARKDFIAPRNAAEEVLAEIWCQVLGLAEVGVEENFFALGGDSILSIQIVARANQAGLKLTPKDVFRHQTIAGLAAASGSAPEQVNAEQGLLTGPAPLTPIQHYFFAQQLPEPQHFNQSLLLRVQERLTVEQLQAAVQAVLEQHDALRLGFQRTANGWEQRYGGAEVRATVAVVDVSEVSGAEQAAALTTASDRVQRSLRWEAGGLLRVVLFETGGAQRLLLVAHHLVVDGVSWRILVEDLGRALQQLQRGERVSLGVKTSSYRSWGERLEAYAESERLREEQGYWEELAQCGAAALPLAEAGGENTIGTGRRVGRCLEVEETRALLQEVPAAYRTQINEVLLTALVEAVGEWRGRRQLLVDLEGHGRNEELFAELELTRTVGWFTNVYPVWLDLEGKGGLGAALKHVKEELRRVPNRGLGYGVLRYLKSDATPLKAISAQVSFNYLGQVDQIMEQGELFSGASESPGAMQSEHGQRPYLLEFTLAIVKGSLQVQCTYSVNHHTRQTIERLTEAYLDELRKLIKHCQSSDAHGFTASDFSLSDFDNAELDQILSEVEL